MATSKNQKSSAKQKSEGAAAFAATAEEALDAMEAASRETIEATSKASQESITEAYDKAEALGASTMGKSTEAFAAMATEGKKNLEATSSSAAAMFSGMTSCNSRVIDGLKASLTFNIACYEKLAAAEAPQEAAAIQVQAMADAVDLTTAQSMELAKIFTETYVNALQPLKTRFDESVSTYVKSLA